MMKIVVKVELSDDKIKQKAMKAVSGLSGVQSVSVDMKDKKLTLIGDTDPVNVVAKLKKLCHPEILTVGPAKEKKEEAPKKDDAKKTGDKKSDSKDDLAALVKAYEEYYKWMRPPYYYHVGTVEEYPNNCVIC